jgi:hypothetical protein
MEYDYAIKYSLKWNSEEFTDHLVQLDCQINKFTKGLSCSSEGENKNEYRILIWKSVGKAAALISMQDI